MLEERMKKAIDIEIAAQSDVEKLCQCLDCKLLDGMRLHTIRYMIRFTQVITSINID